VRATKFMIMTLRKFAGVALVILSHPIYLLMYGAARLAEKYTNWFDEWDLKTHGW